MKRSIKFNHPLLACLIAIVGLTVAVIEFNRLHFWHMFFVPWVMFALVVLLDDGR